MSAIESPGQSPPPSRQTGPQLHDPPSDGHGVNTSSGNQDESKADLERLSSNPPGPLDAHVEELSKKKYKNVAGKLTDA